MSARKLVTFSYDDGISSDKKLVGIFNRYGMKCTFNLNSGIMSADNKFEFRQKTVRRMSSEEIGGMYDGHEIAMHFLTHPHPFGLSDEELEKEITRDIENLTELFSQKIVGAAYPYGEYDERIATLLGKNGIEYARTVKSTHSFEKQENLLMFNPTCHHNDERLMELAKIFAQEENEKDTLFYVWGHSYEFEGYDNWDVIERLCDFLASNENITPCTNAEAFGI